MGRRGNHGVTKLKTSSTSKIKIDLSIPSSVPVDCKVLCIFPQLQGSLAGISVPAVGTGCSRYF